MILLFQAKVLIPNSLSVFHLLQVKLVAALLSSRAHVKDTWLLSRCCASPFLAVSAVSTPLSSFPAHRSFAPSQKSQRQLPGDFLLQEGHTSQLHLFLWLMPRKRFVFIFIFYLLQLCSAKGDKKERGKP